MKYTVQVTKTLTSRSYKKIDAGSMIEAKKIIDAQIRNGDFNPKDWIMQPVEYDVVPLIGD